MIGLVGPKLFKNILHASLNPSLVNWLPNSSLVPKLIMIIFGLYLLKSQFNSVTGDILSYIFDTTISVSKELAGYKHKPHLEKTLIFASKLRLFLFLKKEVKSLI